MPKQKDHIEESGLDIADVAILRGVRYHESLREMRYTTCLASASSVSRRIMLLEKHGYLVKPTKRKARMRELTDKGRAEIGEE